MPATASAALRGGAEHRPLPFAKIKLSMGRERADSTRRGLGSSKSGDTIFLSYAHQDRAVALKIADQLRSGGLRVWNPEQEILPGVNWAAELGTALASAWAMVVLLSPDATASKEVRMDMSYALGAKHLRDRLIPVYIGPAKGAPWILGSLPSVRYAGPGKTAKRIAELLGQGSETAKDKLAAS